MRLLFIVIVGLWSFAANAQNLTLISGPKQLTLLELYTSEGCSSCPPAEKWLGSLKRDPRLWRYIVPVAYSVDYWNYMGWRDPFVNKRWSARQHAYVQSGAVSSVYTPGFVANGEEWTGWFGPKIVPLTGKTTGILGVKVRDGAVSARYYPAHRSRSGWTLHVAMLGFGIKSTISTGKDAGKKLTRDFVVLNQMDIDSPNSRWRVKLPKINQPSVKRLGLAVWVTKVGSMTPEQAAGGWLTR